MPLELYNRHNKNRSKVISSFSERVKKALFPFFNQEEFKVIQSLSVAAKGKLLHDILEGCLENYSVLNSVQKIL